MDDAHASAAEHIKSKFTTFIDTDCVAWIPAAEYLEVAAEHYTFKAAVENERDKYKSLARTRGQKLAAFAPMISGIADALDDEGDRVYLGSTNDADRLRDLAAELQEANWEMADPDLEPDYPKENIRLLAERDAINVANKTFRAALSDVREEICAGPVGDTLWHRDFPAETTVDFICNTLNDNWSYDEWLAARNDKNDQAAE